LVYFLSISNSERSVKKEDFTRFTSVFFNWSSPEKDGMLDGESPKQG